MQVGLCTLFPEFCLLFYSSILTSTDYSSLFPIHFAYYSYTATEKWAKEYAREGAKVEICIDSTFVHNEPVLAKRSSRAQLDNNIMTPYNELLATQTQAFGNSMVNVWHYSHTYTGFLSRIFLTDELCLLFSV